MLYCNTCHNTFSKPAKKGAKLGLLWIIFFFISMGLGIILWLVFLMFKKDVCPYCKSEHFMDAKYRRKEGN